MRFAVGLLLVCLSAALTPAADPAAASPPEPSCAAGPATVGDTTYGTPCADVIVAPAAVATVEGGGGDDVIVPAQLAVAESCPEGCHLGVGSQTFEGGEGDDVVYGERGNDILRGGGGNDQLFGGIGDDQLLGGPGNDRLAGGFGADAIDGGSGGDYVRGDGTIDRIKDTGGGFDTLSYSTGITPSFGGIVPAEYGSFPPPGGERGVRLELGIGGENANNGIAPLGGGVDEVEVGAFEVFVGTPFSDYVIGTERGEAIYGGGGADALVGNGGADTLVGGADGDYTDGGGAVPRDPSKVSVGLMTPPGATPYSQLYLVGSSGADSIAATYSPASVGFHLAAGSFDQSAGDAGGCNVESASDATCSLSFPLDSVLIAGMDGADAIAAESFPSSVGLVAIGGEGNDSITGGEASEDVLVDGPGTGQDGLSALGGDDALLHNGGGDDLLGGNGNDLFLSNSVCDGESLAGGSGRDNSSWARFKEGVGANLETGAAGRLGSGSTPDCTGGTLDSLSEIEDLEGSSFADVLYGNPGPNQLLGHPGPDTYSGGAGADSILANSGDSDPAIDCGANVDSALIDFPPFVDGPPVNCESVTEAAPNSFRTVTQLPPPPPPPPPPPVDLRPPQTRISFGPPTVTFTLRKWRSAAFRFTSDEAGSRFRCKLDRKLYRGCASPRIYRVKAGRHAFRVFAIDRAGNADPTPALFRFSLRRR
jgi:Ca2+-binding RTX toxin-like protein